MSAIIDIIGSRIAGTVILLVIISSIFAANNTNYNVKTLLRLNTTANQVAEVIDMAFLEPIGQNATASDNVIVSANNKEIIVKNVKPDGTIVIKMNTISGNHFLTIHRNGVEEYNTTPFYFESPEIFTFLDKNNTAIVPNSSNYEDIYGVRVDIVLIAPSMGKGDNHNVRYPLTFWRNFKGVYLKDGIEEV